MVQIVKIAWEVDVIRFLMVFLLTVIVSVFTFSSSFILGRVVDIFSTRNPLIVEFLPWVLLLILLNVIPAVIGLVESTLDGQLWRKIDMEIDLKLYGHLASLDIGTIEDPEFQKILSQVNNRSVGAIHSLYNWLLMNLASIVQVVVVLGVAWAISPLISIALVVGCIPIYFLEQASSKHVGAMWIMRLDEGRPIVRRESLFRTVQSLVQIKTFSISNFLTGRIRSLWKELHIKLDKSEWKNIRILAFTEVFFALAIGAAFFIAIERTTAGAITVGRFVFVATSLMTFIQAFASLLRSFGRMSQHKPFASRYYDILEMKPFLRSDNKSIIYSESKPPRIEFKNVSFAYPETTNEVIKNISCVFEPGQTIALVGLNGAGKTTFIKLLSRVYDPTKGEILINGIPLRKLNIESWQKHIAILFQEFNLYEVETVRSNIEYGDVDRKAEPGEVEALAKAVHADSFIQEYEKGYEEVIGREFHGVKPSRGQEQKLALARVLYRKAPLLILDEPTAAVDAVSEDGIFEYLHSSHKDQTVILISHKFSNVRKADQIILIEGGTIKEQGNHDELMKKNGTYAELFRMQAEGFQ